MKIVLYDPLYSKVGHFYRYNLFLIQLLNSLDIVEKIFILAENEELKQLENFEKVTVYYLPTEVHSMQEKSMKATGFAKLELLWKSYKNYRKVISKINATDCDFVFFSSNGQLSFWISCLSLSKKCIVSAINIKWLFEKKAKPYLLYYTYRKYLLNASMNFFTEEIYAKKAAAEGVKKVTVFPDRYLDESLGMQKKTEDKLVKMITVGTISASKSPLSFLKEWKQLNVSIKTNYSYGIYGKVMDDSLSELMIVTSSCSNTTFVNEYVSAELYNELMRDADIVVIPYSSEYTKFLTSGVMWDCFQMQKPILCPDIEPFRHYIKKYEVGYLYQEGELDKTLSRILEEKTIFKTKISNGFKKLVQENSFENLQQKMEAVLKSL